MTEIEQAFQRGAEAMRQVCVKALQDEVNRQKLGTINYLIRKSTSDSKRINLTLELPKSTEGGP